MTVLLAPPYSPVFAVALVAAFAGLMAGVAWAWWRLIDDRDRLRAALDQSRAARQREAAEWAAQVQQLVDLAPTEPASSGPRRN